MSRLAVAAFMGLALALLAGCGGGGTGDGAAVPPPGGGGSEAVQVGPLLVRPASAAGFVAQDIPNPNGPISLVALYGSRITYMASQAYLDRIVFSRNGGSIFDYDLWVCNLDGSNAVRLLDNVHQDLRPTWSPSGTRIAFDRATLSAQPDIVVMAADGTGPQKITTDPAEDSGPAWDALGDQIVFQSYRTASWQIFTMFPDGTGQTNVSNNAYDDYQPSCSPNAQDPMIAFSSTRDGNYEIYGMRQTGAEQTRLTNTPTDSKDPDFSPDGYHLALVEWAGTGPDIWTMSSGGPNVPVPFRRGPLTDNYPAWSTDDRFICYVSNEDGDLELMLRETTEPYRIFQVTRNSTADTYPDLGSPTLQTDRVIIGPAGSDWGGGNPIWSNSDAGVAAYAADGYRNFVRIGIAAANLPTLSISPLATTAVNGFDSIGGGAAPLGVVVEAAEIVNLREDSGRGQTPTLWQLDPLDPTAVLL